MGLERVGLLLPFGAWLLFLAAGIRPIIGDTVLYLDSTVALLDGRPGSDGFHGYAAQLLYLPAVIVDRLTALSLEQTVLIESSLVMALAGWFVLPWFVSTVTGRPVELVDRVVITVGLWALFGAYASFALTDFPALILFLGGVGLMWRNPLLAGLALGLAYNLRPAYVVALVGVVILLLIRRQPRVVGALALGLALALAPQAVVNIKTGVSPIPPVPAYSSQNANTILAASLRYQRTATSTDPAWPSEGIVSCDPAGVTSYLSPAAAPLLVRHVVNGLWLDQRGPVVERVGGTSPLGIVSIALVGLLLAWAVATRRTVLILVALACVPAIVAVVEPRHFLPLAVVSVAILLPAVRWLRGSSTRTRAATAVLCVGLVLGASGIALATTAHEVPGAWTMETPAC